MPGFDAGKSGSKKVTKRRRRSAAKDRKAIAITRVLAPSAVSPAAVPLVADATPLLLPSNDNEEASTDTLSVTPLSVAKGGIEKSTKAAKIHAWEHTTDLGKLTAAYRVLEASGEGYAFSLDCSPDEIAAALRHPQGFTDYFARRINRALKRALGYVPLYGFSVDIGGGDRLHPHGAIAANDNELNAIHGALCHAGGKWASKWHSEHQCELERLYSPHVWASYCVRHRGTVRRIIGGKTIAITTPLRRRAKELWSVVRITRLLSHTH